MSPLRCFFSLCLMSKCLIIKLVILYTSLSVRSSVISIASTYAHPCLPDRRRLCLWCDGCAVNVSIFEQIQLQVVLTASDDQLFPLGKEQRGQHTSLGGAIFPSLTYCFLSVSLWSADWWRLTMSGWWSGGLLRWACWMLSWSPQTWSLRPSEVEVSQDVVPCCMPGRQTGGPASDLWCLSGGTTPFFWRTS